jgi:hypothetical protein
MSTLSESTGLLAVADCVRSEPVWPDCDWLSETVSCTVFDNKRDNIVTSCKRVQETYRDFIIGRLKPRPQVEKDGPAIICATFLDGSGRKDAGVEEIHFIQLDFDNTSSDGLCANPVTKDKIELWLKTEGWAGYIYETYSNTAEWPKLRLVLFLTKPIKIRHHSDDPAAAANAQLYKKFYHYIAGRSGFDYDKTCASLSRLFYLPAFKIGSAPSYAVFIPGARIDFEATISEIPPEQRKSNSERATHKAIIDGYMTPERQAFDRVWASIRKHLSVAEFLETVPDWSPVSGEKGKAQGCCPWQDEHNTQDAPGATPAYAYDAHVAEHGVATVGCLHNGCSGKSAADFVFEVMQQYEIGLEELREYLTDEGKAAFDALKQNEAPSKAELEEAFVALERLVSEQAEYNAYKADVEKLGRLVAQRQKLDADLERARRRSEKAAADLEDATLAEEEAQAAVAAALAKLKPSQLSCEVRETREQALLLAEAKLRSTNAKRERAETVVEQAKNALDAAKAQVADINERMSMLNIEREAPTDQTGKIRAATADLAKRLAVFEEGVDREVFIEKLAALSGQNVNRIRSTLRAERRQVQRRLPRHDQSQSLETFNNRFCLVRVGKSAEIAEKPMSPGDPYAFLRLETFRTEQAPERRLADQWLEWSGRDLRTSVCFRPHVGPWDQHEAGELNLWTGLSKTGVAGDWGLLRTWLWEDACHRNPLWFAFVMCWLADIVQDPGRKKGSALVLRSSAKGTGKSHLANVMERILGRYSSAGVTSPDQVTGKFNAVLAEKLLVVLEEAFFAGSHAAVSALKAIITSQTVMIERKGVDPIKSDNYCRVLIATNQNWAVHTDGTDERRYFVLDVSNRHAKDRSYWTPLVSQMETEAGLLALLYDLERMRRPDFIDLRNPPQTPWLADQALHSLPGEARWLHHILTEELISFEGASRPIWNAAEEGGGLLGLDSDRAKAITTAEAFSAARDYLQRAGIKARLTPEDLGRFLASFGVTRRRPRSADGGRPYTYDFPDLETMRAAFSAKYGVRFDSQSIADLELFGLEGLPAHELEAWRAYAEGRTDMPQG